MAGHPCTEAQLKASEKGTCSLIFSLKVIIVSWDLYIYMYVYLYTPYNDRYLWSHLTWCHLWPPMATLLRRVQDPFGRTSWPCRLPRLPVSGTKGTFLTDLIWFHSYQRFQRSYHESWYKIMNHIMYEYIYINNIIITPHRYHITCSSYFPITILVILSPWSSCCSGWEAMCSWALPSVHVIRCQGLEKQFLHHVTHHISHVEWCWMMLIHCQIVNFESVWWFCIILATCGPSFNWFQLSRPANGNVHWPCFLPGTWY